MDMIMTDIDRDSRGNVVGWALGVAVLLLIAALTVVVVLAGQQTTVRLAGGDEGALTPAWQCLLDQGYRGTPGDGMTALYPTQLSALWCGAGTTEVASDQPIR